MQETRQHILSILRKHEQATVDEIVSVLRAQRGDNITPVTVRHHLSILLEDNFIESSQLRYSTRPGRPQHVYILTAKGESLFPNNYQHLATHLLREIERTLDPATVNVIIEGMANQMMGEADVLTGSIEIRLAATVEYLSEHGYEARFEPTEGGFLLHTLNCPYHHISQETPALCQLDMRLISHMLGVVPRLQARIATGDQTCTYFVPHTDPVLDNEA